MAAAHDTDDKRVRSACDCVGDCLGHRAIPDQLSFDEALEFRIGARWWTRFLLRVPGVHSKQALHIGFARRTWFRHTFAFFRGDAPKTVLSYFAQKLAVHIEGNHRNAVQARKLK